MMSANREKDPLLSVAPVQVIDRSSINANGGDKKAEKMVSLSDASYSSNSSTRTTSTNGTASSHNNFTYTSTDMTAEAIRQCEKFILSPYANALKFIGWLPYTNSVGGYIWQGVLVFLWLFCIIATMVTQILSCFKRDPFIPGKKITIDELNITTEAPLYDLGLLENTTDNTTEEHITKIITCENHVISSLILLDITLLLVYFYGIYLFCRGEESEHLFSLASRVFIKNSEAQSSSGRLIITIGVLFICGIMWLLFSLTVRILASVSMELFEDHLYIEWESLRLYGAVKISLLIYSLLGFFTFDMVYMFSIMNYVIQTEMNIYLLWDVRRLIKVRKYDHIDGAIKDVQKCKRYVDILNGKTATHTALALFVLANLALSAIINLNQTRAIPHLLYKFPTLAEFSAFLNMVCWCLLVSLPFVQAARVTYWCDQLRDLGPEIRGRVYAAYADATLLDLDSLLSFLQSIKLRAAIFGVPIYPWLLHLVLVVFFLTMLVLFQVNAYSITEYV